MIVVENLIITKGSIRLVQGIGFTVNRGEVLGIVGESGSGKSLTAQAIINLLPAGLEQSEASKITFEGQLIQQVKNYRGGKVGMVFQEPMNALNPTMKIGAQIAESLLLRKRLSEAEITEKVLILLKKVQLDQIEGIVDRYPHQLSGGQKQRVLIAIAISSAPALIIADEATTDLDVTVQKDILKLLKELVRNEKISMIFISHDLHVVKDLADRCIVMRSGRIVEAGSVTQIFNHPSEPYTKALLQCRPPLDWRPVRLASVANFEGGSFFDLQEVNLEERQKRLKELYRGSVLLEVRNLVVSYSRRKGIFGKATAFPVLQNISFRLFEGESLGLIGESGCGKTTLGKAIVQQVVAQTGEIIYNESRGVDRKKLYKSIQVVFQDPHGSLNPRLSVGESIREVLARGENDPNLDFKGQTMKLLEKVGLSNDDFFKYPHEFSGGQKQRIAIARALAANPKILICDEAVSALDVSVQAQILNLLQDLKRETGLTYIFISHDLSVVKYFCDRIIVLNKSGKIEEEGESDSLYQNPTSKYTQKLIAAVPK